ncbi:syncytin-A-like [Ambystoma mexicanum]|uniref:syncytin-A-like n=1 Tax=Ambystoma mexicanum TaxID=8296 RepID=UPI0037E9BEB6
MPAMQEASLGRRKYSPMITQTENMWTYLAQQVLNIMHFCLTDVPNAEALLTTCLVAVPTPVPVLKHIFGVTHNDSLVQDSDIRQSFSVYEYCRFCKETDRKWRNLTRIITYNITQGDVCYFMTCNTKEIGKCQQLNLTKQKNQTVFEKRLCSRVPSTCTSVNNTMSCNHTVIAASHLNHVKLPTGWLFSCGNITFTYIPANISGGLCALTRLGLMMFPLHPAISRNKRSTFESVGLSPDCDSHVHLLSEAEVLALTLSLVGVWGLSAGGYTSLIKLACLVVKGLNHTSQALEELLLDSKVIRKATLQNRAAIDYLLLKHNLGCNAVEGMCCFNLSDHSRSIESHIRGLRDLISQVSQEQTGNWWDWLFSWIPDIGGTLRYAFACICIILAIIIACCCCIQCIPNLVLIFRRFQRPPPLPVGYGR